MRSRVISTFLMDLYNRIRKRKAGLWDEMLSKLPVHFVRDHVTKWRESPKDSSSNWRMCWTFGPVEETDIKFSQVWKYKNWKCMSNGGPGEGSKPPPPRSWDISLWKLNSDSPICLKIYDPAPCSKDYLFPTPKVDHHKKIPPPPPKCTRNHSPPHTATWHLIINGS